LSFVPINDGGKVNITIKDSGSGFDFEHFIHRKSKIEASSALSGRGISLVSQLCEHLEYQSNGTTVQASYCWVN